MDLVEKARIMDGMRINRALARLASEIVEENHGAGHLYLIGIQRRGVPLAERLAEKIADLEGERPPVGVLDITLYRDDLSTVGANPIVNRTDLPIDVEGRNVLLIDDVLYTGRTIRAALDQLIDFGRPRRVQLAVLIDRGKEHRELPIQADFVGKFVPTKKSEIIKVMLDDFDGEEAVAIVERPLTEEEERRRPNEAAFFVCDWQRHGISLMRAQLSQRHLLGIRGLTAEEITHILDTAETFREVSEREIKKVPTLRGRTVINLFFEPSTRTRTSFEIAGKRLSADVININSSSSSVSKGETLLDMARNLEAMSPALIDIRHPSAGAPHQLPRLFRAAAVNARDGAPQHPTQALLDALTIRQQKGSFKNLKVAILGDILHSRVARSNAHLLTTLGAHVSLAGPGTLAPPAFASLAVGGNLTVERRIEDAIEGADVVMVLRIQRERQDKAFLPSLREDAGHYGLKLKRLELARPDAIVMHPGPMNRGIEIASDVADGSRSLILDQVANGLAVRMAVLYLLGGGAGTASVNPNPTAQTKSETESQAETSNEPLSVAATVGGAHSEKS